MEHIVTDTSEPECGTDSSVVGGSGHGGPIFLSHMVYADKPDVCYCSHICLAHTPYAWGFTALEIGADAWYSATITTEPC